MANQYSAEFKMDAVKRVRETGGPVSKISVELSVNENTLNRWIKRFREKPVLPFPGSCRLSPEDQQIKNPER
jgi:transposase